MLMPLARRGDKQRQHGHADRDRSGKRRVVMDTLGQRGTKPDEWPIKLLQSVTFMDSDTSGRLQPAGKHQIQIWGVLQEARRCKAGRLTGQKPPENRRIYAVWGARSVKSQRQLFSTGHPPAVLVLPYAVQPAVIAGPVFPEQHHRSAATPAHDGESRRKDNVSRISFIQRHNFSPLVQAGKRRR